MLFRQFIQSKNKIQVKNDCLSYKNIFKGFEVLDFFFQFSTD